jgi:2-phosphoglycerate kinase
MALQNIHLIGGAPLTGKTTLARHMAQKPGVVPLSTDNIRQWMRDVCSEADYPKLFSGHKMSAEEYYAIFDTPAKALAEEIAQGRDVERGVRALLARNLPWDTLILEGIAITPKFATQLRSELLSLSFEVTFLHDDDRDRIKHRIYQRGLWGESASYPDHLKPMEVEWVVAYNQWYLEQTQKYDYKISSISEVSV